MNPFQEPKYVIKDGKLHNRQSGEQIPDDEPVFILRARDIHATGLLSTYWGIVADPTHKQAAGLRLRQFEEWKRAHPERMKEPDTQLTSDWEHAQ